MKSKKISYSSIIIVMLTIILCISYNFIHSNQIKKSEKVSQYPMEGYGIMLKNPDGSSCDNFNLKSINDEFNYSLKFINNTNKSNKFILSAYIDYNQVPFYLENDNLITKYEFDLSDQSEKDIPIKINTDTYSKGTHVLNFIVYTNVNKTIEDIKENPDIYQAISKHNLIIGGDADINKPELLSFSKSFYKNKKHIFQLNISKDADIKNDLLNQSLQIKAKPDEIVKIPVNIGSFKEADEYVFWMTLNYKQVSIDQNLKYWYFKLPQEYAIARNVELKVPHDKGTYKLSGFLAPSPWRKVGESKKLDEIQSSGIIELIVN